MTPGRARRARLAAIAIIPALLHVACGASKERGNGEHDEAGGAAESAAAGIRTTVVERAPFVRTILATGTVAPSPGSVASLGAPGPTRITRVFVAPGDSVEKGDPLVEFESLAFDAEAQSREANVAAAEKALDRARRLAEAGVVPSKDVERAEAELAAARADAVVAERSQQLATLRAPLSGIVTRVDALLGAPVDLGGEIVQIVDMSALDIVLHLSPAAAADARVGESASLAASETDSTVLGDARITSVAAIVDSLTRGVEVRARIVRAARTLRLGEALSVRIVTAEVPDAIAIPQTALIPDEEELKVFVVDPDGIARARRVHAGGRNGGLVEILSGLESGERIVVEGGYGLEDSTRVPTDAS